MKFDHWFPTIIGISKNPNHASYDKELIKECLSLKKKVKSGGKFWVSNTTYNTSSTYDLTNHPKFKLLNFWVYDQVKEFSSYMKYKTNFIASGVWFNVYQKGDFQEYHTHPRDSLSAIYFLKGNKKGAKTFFKHPVMLDAQDPLKENIDYTAQNCFYLPEAGNLLLFRSTSEHCVEKHNIKDIRITLAYNFRIN
jgi:uncharacterized protein (TIGR02466 family)